MSGRNNIFWNILLFLVFVLLRFLSFLCTYYCWKMHTAPMGWRYPYEMDQRKGWYFLIPWYVVVRKWVAVFLKTFGLLRNNLLNISNFALFWRYDYGVFISTWWWWTWYFLIILHSQVLFASEIIIGTKSICCTMAKNCKI